MICRICKRDKDLKYFGNNKRRSNGKNNFCKECKKNIDETSYNKRKNKISAQRRNKRDIFRIEYEKLKIGGKCFKCGETKHYLLDFHHLDNNKKEFNIGHKAWQTMNIEKIKEETKKCILLCSNHHRELHYLIKIENIILEQYLLL